MFDDICSTFLDQKTGQFWIWSLGTKAMAMEPPGISGYTLSALLQDAELLESMLPGRKPSPESAIKLDYLEIVDGVPDA